jgi:hypothetical protein
VENSITMDIKKMQVYERMGVTITHEMFLLIPLRLSKVRKRLSKITIGNP